MKSNIIKYIFILFAIFIILFAIYKINGNQKESNINDTVTNNMNSNASQIIRNLRIGIANFDNLNPIITQNKDIINLSTIIYEPLLGITEDYRIEKKLAEEWSKINETSYIVKLRENLKWDNDTELTATDIKFTIEKLKEGKSVYSDNVTNIDNVEILDVRTVRINLTKEEAFFEYNLIFPIISSKQFSGEKDFFNSRISPLATGMYKVSSATSNSMQLVKNDKWYGSENNERIIETITLNLYGTMGEVYNNFKIGNIDLICTSNLNISDHIGTIGYTSKDYKGRELDFISLNCEDTILSNKEVRQAISFAIDKKNIVSSVYGNNYYTSSFPLDYGNYMYQKENISTYDQEKAKKVLTDTGWVYKYGRWQKTENGSTKTIRLNLIVDSSNKERVKVAEKIDKQLENIGISVTIYKVSNSNYKNYLKNKNYDMIITGIYSGYSPDLSYFLGKDNIANYENQEVLQILNDINSITDEKLLKEKYDRIISIYEDEVPYICLYRNKGKVIYDLKLTGEFNPTNYTTYYHMNKWYRQ